ncbi:MAG: hypothetical protein CL662_09400 [Bacteroidetes bacterium]|nr:hypothetical protein [Bacteroidota bacterium]|tara:strand:+ start:21969 stop:24692 length:2724 start_codon:yes stop_codon:yes gene_type:complete
MQKKGLLLLLAIVFLGCGSGMKSRWGNFTAYYNTYYNAKKSYNDGLKKVLDSKITYNPQQPIRIHEVPINAGTQDFDKAIEKGAEILRKHNESKWVDNSLNLIGKSYYFKKEYFSADQKFQEISLTTNDESLIQESILWRSRVLLEMELYGQGIQYINEQLNNNERLWNSGKKAELKIILAQYFVVQENWQDAIIQLSEALPNLNDKKYKERGYFLLGQLFERTGNYREAYNAYRTVEKFYYDYDLQYLALRKRAETARLLGDNESALGTFTKMVRDDKNTEFKTELDYEIAKTYQEQEKFEEAETIYKNLLKNTVDRPSVETKALTYYGLAEIYQYGYNDFEMAAAYYDTSARQNAPFEKLPESYNAGELAQSFGEYARLKNELSYRDSLLWVSNLSQPRLDSLIAEIKKRKLSELAQARKNQEERQNTLVNVSNEQETTSIEGGNGFLNVNSVALQENARTQFIAIWGDRPLVDNWRVRELVTSSGSSEVDNTNGNDVTVQRTRSLSSIETSVDLSEVPFQPSEKVEAKKEIGNLKYQLGNLFFISLEMPDSAAIYFQDVIQNHPTSDEVAVSYYSLSEIQSSMDLTDEAEENARQLIQKFPNSRYAERLADKYNILIESDIVKTEFTLKEKYQNLKADTSLTKPELADRSTKLAIENSKNNESAAILFEATQMYIELGKEQEIFRNNYNDWVSSKMNWEQDQTNFKRLQDSLKVEVKDTSLNDLRRNEFQQIIDSTLTKPNFSVTFPYYGEYWDKARINIDLFISNFRNSKQMPSIRVLKNELEKPVMEEAADTTNSEIENLNNAQNTATFCSDLESPPQIRGGMDKFLNELGGFDTDTKEIHYSLIINQRGIIEEYEMVSKDTIDREIVNFYNVAIENSLSFDPVIENGEAIKIQCTMKFPVN